MQTPNAAAKQTLQTPHGSKDTHSEMRSVLEDLKSDFKASASTEALELMDRLEMPTPSPGKDGGGATLTALRDELRAAKSAVRVLKLDKERTHHKLERLDSLLVKERSSLRDVLQAARKAFADLKLEKETMRKKLQAERKKHAAQLQHAKDEGRVAEKEIARLQGVIRGMEKDKADVELSSMPAQARGAIEQERENLSTALAIATQQHDEDAAEICVIDEEMQRLFSALQQATDEVQTELVQVHRDERQAELANEQTKARVMKVTEQAKGDKERLKVGGHVQRNLVPRVVRCTPTHYIPVF